MRIAGTKWSHCIIIWAKRPNIYKEIWFSL
jgi:hypothetical protein